MMAISIEDRHVSEYIRACDSVNIFITPPEGGSPDLWADDWASCFRLYDALFADMRTTLRIDHVGG